MVDNFEMDIDNKFIKRLNDMNQDMKYVFDVYYIFPKGIVVSDDIYYRVTKGTHYGVTDFKLHDSITDVVCLDSTVIFQTIKEHKKELKQLKIMNGDIILSGETDYVIGCVIKLTSPDIRKLFKFVAENNTFIRTFKGQISLHENDVIDLVGNQYKNIAFEQYQTKITKELTPGLKKSHDLNILMTDSNNDELFKLFIQVERSTVTTIHQYTCILL